MSKRIMEPLTIKGMKLKNRVAFAPILGMPVDPEGFVNDETIRWFEERAQGGVGFIMTGTLESISPENLSKKAPVMEETAAGMYKDEYIKAWTQIVDMVHSYDVKIGGQLAAPGPMMAEGPSPPPFPDSESPMFGIFDLMALEILPVDEVSIDRMEFIKKSMATAAGRLKSAGFDCVELHCGHGGANLHAAFLSPFYNKRTDNYGGSWENRVRFIVETVGEIRNVVGNDFPIVVRFSVDERLGERGITLEASAKFIVPILEKAGVDVIDVSQGSVTHSIEGVSIPLYYPRGCFISNAEQIKKVTKLPVIGVGRILDLDMGEQFLEQGKLDIVYLGSELMADPEAPNKYFENRQDETRKCIGCKPIQCGTPCTIYYDSAVDRIPLTPAEKEKKVLIIGGGVAGMEAARIATLRGHKVTLIEKKSELGGMVSVLAQTKLTSEFRNIITYLATQMKKLKVDVRVCKEATAADIDDIKPDVVITACGASLVIPDIAQNTTGVMDHVQACREPDSVGQRVVIWGLNAAEMAISLAEEGKDVTLMGSGNELSLGGPWVEGARKFYIMRKLTDIPVARGTKEAERVQNPQLVVNAKVESIGPQGVKVSVKGADDQTLPYDSLIISRRRVSNKSLFEELQAKSVDVHKIGDCGKGRSIKEAICSANEVARKI